MNMELNILYNKVIEGQEITCEEALFLYESAPLNELLNLANKIRFIINPGNKVSWQIDRNVNYTNVCISGCKFCNFHCKISRRDVSYITTPHEYRNKIDELFRYGGDQLLLQGGLHPELDIIFYEELFRRLKRDYPTLKLNALGPPEVFHIARVSNLTIEETLKRLIDAGLDTLPGAGAEILSDRVRKLISPAKPGVNSWVKVMKCAHKLGLGTTATMVYGHIETLKERVDHLILLRDMQKGKPEGTPGFRAFICWPMQTEGTKLAEMEQMSGITAPDAIEHLKMVAISRIVLNNIPHIQASWLTIGMETAQLALHSGADDMGSIMIEENVVSSAGAENRTDAAGIQKAIKEAGFVPWLRNQDYSPR
jgi:cyclic dehypoxanthinyl futalosine synthase